MRFRCTMCGEDGETNGAVRVGNAIICRDCVRLANATFANQHDMTPRMTGSVRYEFIRPRLVEAAASGG